MGKENESEKRTGSDDGMQLEVHFEWFWGHDAHFRAVGTVRGKHDRQ